MHPLLEELTDAQREAVTHVDGPLLILAGPGSGKTRVVTHRIAWLLEQGIPGHQILALTFTNKAADEMRSRVDHLAPRHGVWVSTFHRYCARILRQYARFLGLRENYTIYDVESSLQVLRQAMARLPLGAQHQTLDSIAQGISWAKNNLITPEKYKPQYGSLEGTVICEAYPLYQKQLLRSNAVDFDDLLLHVAMLLLNHPEVRTELDARFRYILVDEYQDTNFAQYMIVRAMSRDFPNLAVTGDPDQSIYGWRGANLRNILDFEDDFPEVKVVRLERNYRSTQRILRVAAELIAHNIQRKQKGLYTENSAGEPVRLIAYSSEREEAEGIAARIAADLHSGKRRPRDFAIFYRVNALSRTIELALHDAGVPYQMVHGLAFFQRQEIKDVMAYLRLLNNPQDNVAMLRAMQCVPRGIGKTTIGRLEDYAEHFGISLLDAARNVADIASIAKRSAGFVREFAAMIDRLTEAATGPMEEIVGLVLTETGYKARLEQSKDEADQERLANTEELLTVARQFDERSGGQGALEAFLEETCLVNDTDDWQETADRVTLMTLHASKGLEFPVVYLIALEGGILPHERTRDCEDQIEEERRLMFVGITRAEEELQLSFAKVRDYRGQRKNTVPSHFLMELPRDEMYMQTPETLPEAQIDFVPDAEPPDFEPILMRDREEPPLRPQRPNFSSMGLTTAAELAGQGTPSVIAPEAFHQGMLVRHAQFGLGRISALSGAGGARMATVDFTSTAGRQRLRLADGALKPVKPA